VRYTDLGVYEFCQGADELRRCVEVLLERDFVDALADVVPEGGFQAL
jgi:hypothetical protein